MTLVQSSFQFQLDSSKSNHARTHSKVNVKPVSFLIRSVVATTIATTNIIGASSPVFCSLKSVGQRVNIDGTASG